MISSLVKLSWLEWLLTIFFMLLAAFLILKATLSIFRSVSPKSNVKTQLQYSIREIPRLYAAGLSLSIASGILIGLPIDNLRCWALLIPVQCIILPWIILAFLGNTPQLIWRDIYIDLRKLINKNKSK